MVGLLQYFHVESVQNIFIQSLHKQHSPTLENQIKQIKNNEKTWDERHLLDLNVSASKEVHGYCGIFARRSYILIGKIYIHSNRTFVHTQVHFDLCIMNPQMTINTQSVYSVRYILGTQKQASIIIFPIQAFVVGNFSSIST